jgi:dTDP-4-amino-4,6-dideoxygalactose transaminase
MWRIPLSDLNYDHREAEAIQQVLASGWLTMGPRTEEFEDKFARYHNADKAVAVANCTCALELVYRFVLNHDPKGRRAIVVPDITFVATANAVIAAGGEPVLCDVESAEKPFLSLAAVEELLRNRDDIAAVSIVHYAGHDAGVEAMVELCDRYQIPVIEDCAHSPGAATASGRPLGTNGLAGCFSFFSNKNISTGEGGMIIPNLKGNSADFGAELYLWAKMARSHGTTGGGTWQRHIDGTAGYNVMFPAYNYRCTEITAALGIAQLEKLEEGNARRRELTQLYHQLLDTVDGVDVLVPDGDIKASAYHILPVLIPDEQARRRVIEALAYAKIQVSHHYPAIHTFHSYAPQEDSVSAALANASAFAARELTLPLHPKLTNAQVHEITGVIKSTVS